MKKHRITEDELNRSIKHAALVTNLGPRFKLDIPNSQTSVTVQQHPQTKEPRIVWVNTYGNVYPNRGHFTFSPQGARAATAYLNNIQFAFDNKV